MMTEDMTEDSEFQLRFGGVARLIGREGLARLAAARGGGVGVGELSIIDLDDVCVTNVNRQLPALDGQIGRPKVEVLAERVRAIHPGCRVEAIAEFFTASRADALLG